MDAHIIILPGWMHTSVHWDLVASALRKKGHAVTVIDIPGFGITPPLSARQSFTDTAAHIKQSIEAVAPKQNILIVGHSFGGRMAIEIAHDLPRLQEIVLIGSPNIYRPTTTLKIKKRLLWLLSPLKKFIPEAIKRTVRSEDYVVAKESELERLISEAITHDQTEKLTNLQTSVQLLWGEQDLQVPLSIAQEITRLLPKATLQTVPNVGHDVHLEKPELLAGKIHSYATAS